MRPVGSYLELTGRTSFLAFQNTLLYSPLASIWMATSRTGPMAQGSFGSLRHRAHFLL